MAAKKDYMISAYHEETGERIGLRVKDKTLAEARKDAEAAFKAMGGGFRNVQWAIYDEESGRLFRQPLRGRAWALLESAIAVLVLVLALWWLGVINPLSWLAAQGL